MKRNTIIQILIVAVIMLLPVLLTAQPQNNPGYGTNGDPDAPIDGGLSLLVAAGVGYGAKRLKEANKQKAK